MIDNYGNEVDEDQPPPFCPSYFGGGYYGGSGKWIQTKFCLVSCGERCDCQPPNGIYQLPPVLLKVVDREDGEPD